MASFTHRQPVPLTSGTDSEVVRGVFSALSSFQAFVGLFASSLMAILCVFRKLNISENKTIFCSQEEDLEKLKSWS